MANGGGSRVPRSSAQVVRTSLDELNTRRRRKGLVRLVLAVAILVVLLRGGNWMLEARPVAAALAADPRTAQLQLDAHLRLYVDPTTLILDLQRPQLADTADLWTALFLASRALASGFEPERVVLARAGEPVFTLSGADFAQLGRDFGLVRNPVVVMRTLMPMLRLPSGAPLPPGDPVDAARRWAAGAP